jgi:Alpha/beta hydrolase of unknown function (DUF900)
MMQANCAVSKFTLAAAFRHALLAIAALTVSATTQAQLQLPVPPEPSITEPPALELVVEEPPALELPVEESTVQEITDPAPSVPETPELTDITQISPTPMPASSLWIVSTHASPQSFKRSCPQFRPGVQRYQPCCGYQQSHFNELVTSLPPGAPVCIMVHGSFVSWDDVCTESVKTYRWLTRDCPGSALQLIIFTWPSDKHIGPFVSIDTCILGRRAERNGFYLADLVQHLPVESPVCLLGHSHGTRVVASAMHLMSGGEIQDHRHPCARCAGRRIRVVFAASAIDHDWFNPGHRFDRALCCTECLLNITNHFDPALKLYPLGRPFASRALGSCGLTRRDRSKLRGYSGKINEMDVSEEFGFVHNWPEYFGRPWVAAKMRNYVHFSDGYALASR